MLFQINSYCQIEIEALEPRVFGTPLYGSFVQGHEPGMEAQFALEHEPYPLVYGPVLPQADVDVIEGKIALIQGVTTLPRRQSHGSVEAQSVRQGLRVTEFEIAGPCPDGISCLIPITIGSSETRCPKDSERDLGAQRIAHVHFEAVAPVGIIGEIEEAAVEIMDIEQEGIQSPTVETEEEVELGFKGAEGPVHGTYVPPRGSIESSVADGTIYLQVETSGVDASPQIIGLDAGTGSIGEADGFLIVVPKAGFLRAGFGRLSRVGARDKYKR